MLILKPHEVLARLGDCPVRAFERGDIVLAEGTTTGRLLFLKQGAVDIVIDEVFLTTVSDPGAVFGDMGFLLDQPHTADVLAVQPSSFYVVEDPAAFLKAEPLTGLYVAVVLAERLRAINRVVIEARSRALDAGQRRGLFIETLDRMGRALQIHVPT